MSHAVQTQEQPGRVLDFHLAGASPQLRSSLCRKVTRLLDAMANMWLGRGVLGWMVEIGPLLVRAKIGSAYRKAMGKSQKPHV